MKRVLSWLILSLSLFCFNSCSTNFLVLSNKGQSKYKIAVPSEPEDIELKAAKRLQKYFKIATGVTLDISRNPSIYTINIGATDNKVVNELKENLKDNGLVIISDNKNIFIDGKGEKGVLYGVYSFLEKIVGISMLAPEVFKLPLNEKTKMSTNTKIIENPSFLLRHINNNIALNPLYREWHKLDNFKKDKKWGLLYHSTFKLVPPNIYYKNHPEYYSLRGNQRVAHQLCMSNPDVLKIAIHSLKKRMKKKPSAIYWFVGQEDNNNFCQCSMCKKGYKMYGGYSGVMVNFVNKIAAQFPDKQFITFAYNLTLSPPQNIKPRKNVIICFAPINASHTRGYISGKKNKGVVERFKDWESITSNLMFWDYWVNFSDILLPFPNIQTFQENIQFFKNNGVKFVYEEGINKKGGQLKELKTYVLAKLLWNPNINVKKEVSGFCKGYYGPAAPEIIKYIDKLRKVMLHENVMLKAGGNKEYVQSYLKLPYLLQYDQILKEAGKKANGEDKYLRRVKEVRASIDFYLLQNYMNKKLQMNKMEVLERKNRIRSLYKKGKIKNVQNYGSENFGTYLESVQIN